MAQLSDDCFAFGGRLMTTAEALALLEERTELVVEQARTTLPNAVGRILAEDIVAASNVPPHDNSAVDGYAVFFNDLDGSRETHLPVTGRVTAGHPLGREAQAGEAIRIFTGAVMPQGPDTVMMQEDCREEDGEVIISPGIKQGANMRRAGEDVGRGDTVLRRGQRLRPQDLGLAASIGRTRLQVYAPLHVAVFSTGDELRKPGAKLPAGCIYDANRYTLIAALKQLGCRVTDMGIIADQPQAVRQALAEAAGSHQLLITSGGVSVGDEDHVKAVVESLGGLYFWRLAIKPGRPIALGQVAGVPFAGLPGNPVAAMVTFVRIVRPMVLLLSGASQIEPRYYRVRSGFDYAKKLSRREMIRARIETDEGGAPTAHRFKNQGSGVLSSVASSDGLVELPEDMDQVAAGDLVDFYPFSEVGA